MRIRTLACAVGALLLAHGTGGQTTANTCSGGGNYNYGCAPSDYTVCNACFPNGASSLAICVAQGDSTGDRVCAARTLSDATVRCVGCSEMTTAADCSGDGAVNCAWDGSRCQFVNHSTATSPTTSFDGTTCRVRTVAPTVATAASFPQSTYSGTFPPTSVTATRPPLTFEVTSDMTRPGIWIQLAQTFRVPASVSALELTLVRRLNASLGDSNNIVFFDNVSATYSDCDAGSVCAASRGQDVVIGGDAGQQSDRWAATPTGNSQTATFGGERVFVLSGDSTVHPTTLSQRLAFLSGARAVTVFAQLRNTNSAVNGYGLITGTWIISTVQPTTSPTTQPTVPPTVQPTTTPTTQPTLPPTVSAQPTAAPSDRPVQTVATQTFVVTPNNSTATQNPAQWIPLRGILAVYNMDVTNTLDIYLKRRVVNGRAEVGNVVYFTNVSVIFTCSAAGRTVAGSTTTAANASCTRTNALDNGNASEAHTSTSRWSAHPVDYVIRTVGTSPAETAFVLADDPNFPVYMLQTIDVPADATGVTVEAMVYNTVANFDITGSGYIYGGWSQRSVAPSSTAPTSAAPSVAPSTKAPTSAPTLDPQACQIAGNTPLISRINSTSADVGATVAITGQFQFGGRVRAECFWWYEDLPYVAYQLAAFMNGTQAILCTVPDPPAPNAAVQVSVGVWVPGVDTASTEACTSHSEHTGAFVAFQYSDSAVLTTSPTPAPDATSLFYNTSVSPQGVGACTACVSCRDSTDSSCTATILSGVRCPSPGPITTTLSPRGVGQQCVCPGIFLRASMTTPGILPEFSTSPCGAIVSVPCYQLGMANEGRGRVSMECLSTGEWNFSSWDASACTRASLANLVNLTDVTDADGLRSAVVIPTTSVLHVRSVATAVSNTLLLGSRDVTLIGDWITTIVEHASAQDLDLSCTIGAELVTALYKLMLVSDLAGRRQSNGFDLAEMRVNVRVSNGVSTATNVSQALVQSLDQMTALLAQSNRAVSSSEALNWTAVCQEDDDDTDCPQESATQQYVCAAETTWQSHNDDSIRTAFWVPFQRFFTARAIGAAMQRREWDGGTVAVNLLRTVAVRRFEPTVQNYGPALAALAPLLLPPGATVSIRGVSNGVLLRADNCSRLLTSGNSNITLDFSDAAFVSPPGCQPSANLDALNVTENPVEMSILTAIGFLNATTSDPTVAIPTIVPSGRPTLGRLDSVELQPATLRRLYGCNGNINLTTASNRGQSLSIFSASDFLRLVNRRSRSSSASLDTELLDGTDRRLFRLGSRVMSFSLGGHDSFPFRVDNLLDPPALLTFTDLPAGYNHTCAFYSFADRAFLTDGVRLVSISDDGTTLVCSTTHNTNFAVLTNVDGTAGGGVNTNAVPEDHARALSIIMYIGLAVSLVCYSAIIVTYLTHRKLLTLGKAVLCHICGTLAVGETAFVLGIIVATESTPSPELCTSLGVLAHYFLLSAFGWMLCEAVFLHTNFTSVFAAFVRNDANSAKRYALFGYGTPLAVVVVTIVMLPDAYDNHAVADGQHCFLSAKQGAIWAFVGPMLAILVANLWMLLRVVRVVSRAAVRKQTGMSETDEKKHIARIRTKRALHASASFFFLLGIGWVFGVFAVGDASLFFQYVFSGVLILQGLCLLYFHCYLDVDARAAWRRRLRKGSTEPPVGNVQDGRRHEKAQLSTKSASSTDSGSTEMFGKPRMVVFPQPSASPLSGQPEAVYLVVDDKLVSSGGSKTLSTAPIEVSLLSGSSIEASSASSGNSATSHSDPPTSFGSENEAPYNRSSEAEMLAL